MRLCIDAFIFILISDISLRAFYNALDNEKGASFKLSFISAICFLTLIIIYVNFAVKYFV